MSNAVINVIPKPITSGRASKGKQSSSPARLSLLYSIHLTVFQRDYSKLDWPHTHSESAQTNIAV